MTTWISLITSLPTENATARMRVWRALKASGAAVLRDGVYLMPQLTSCRQTLEAIAQEVQNSGGTAHVLGMDAPDSTQFVRLFDRSAAYADLLKDVVATRTAISPASVSELLKPARKLRKDFASLIEIDFFPGEAQKQVDAALTELELALARALSPNEPHSMPGSVARLSRGDYQNRTWATRARPWADRLASAWLIRRFIDPAARLLWIQASTDDDAPVCPAEAVGFDFDGAEFSHVGSRVTFEVLVTRFDLEQPGLDRLGAIVHYLDTGGIQPPEAIGVESILGGMRAAIADDDQLLDSASLVFDGLLSHFQQAPTGAQR